jgi:hypothetical protein
LKKNWALVTVPLGNGQRNINSWAKMGGTTHQLVRPPNNFVDVKTPVTRKERRKMGAT